MDFTELVHHAIQNVHLGKIPVRKVKETRADYGDNAPVVELVNGLIEEAVGQHASDIHLEPVQKGLQCRIRKDGQLQKIYGIMPTEISGSIISRIKIMGGMDIAEHRIPQDGRFIHEGKAGRIDVRVSVLPLINGEKIVMRLLNDSRRFMDIKGLDFSPANEKLFRQLIHGSFGAVIIAGPVNSGKTTTLYAALHEVESGKENIVTIEDPVEYQISGINQLQVNPKAGLTFASGLRASLRQDTDLIMLGETRDEETAALAIRAALTGHLLFTTLHTASAAEALLRLMDMGVKGYMLSSAVRGVVAQRLLRRLCPKCRKEVKVKPGSDEAKYFAPGSVIYEAGGCQDCDFTGYQGRIPVQEVMIMDEEIGAMLKMAAGTDLKELDKYLHKKGMTDLWQDGIAKIKEGKSSLEELRRVLENESV